MIKLMRTPRGFTLIEMVMVIVITGIIAGMVAVFIRAPVQGYFDLESRVALTDAADTALRRISRDLRLALPNSVTVSADNLSASFLLTRTGGRYRAETTAAGAGNPLRPGEETAESFDILGDITLGGALALPQEGEWVVIYNLGIPGADAYESGASSNRANVGVGSTATSIQLDGAKTFPFASPGNRFHIVAEQVTYACENGAVVRRWRAPPETGAENSAILVSDVDCNKTAFTYNQNIIHQRWGLVAMTLTLTRNNEAITLYHEAHVSNLP